jgi:hypothetical protein
MRLTIIWALGERKKPVPFKAEKISKENVHIKVFVHCRLKSMAIIHTHMCVVFFLRFIDAFPPLLCVLFVREI